MLMPSVFGENLFDDFFDFPVFEKMDRQAQKELYGRRAANVMKTDIREKDGHYEMTIDLPGFTRDEVTADLDNGYLTITASKGLDKDEQEQENGRFIRRERYAGTCSRTFYVGEGIQKNDIKARFEHGLLTLLVPKTVTQAEGSTRRIEIE